MLKLTVCLVLLLSLPLQIAAQSCGTGGTYDSCCQSSNDKQVTISGKDYFIHCDMDITPKYPTPSPQTAKDCIDRCNNDKNCVGAFWYGVGKCVHSVLRAFPAAKTFAMVLVDPNANKEKCDERIKNETQGLLTRQACDGEKQGLLTRQACDGEKQGLLTNKQCQTKINEAKQDKDDECNVKLVSRDCRKKTQAACKQQKLNKKECNARIIKSCQQMAVTNRECDAKCKKNCKKFCPPKNGGTKGGNKGGGNKGGIITPPPQRPTIRSTCGAPSRVSAAGRQWDVWNNCASFDNQESSFRMGLRKSNISPAECAQYCAGQSGCQVGVIGRFYLANSGGQYTQQCTAKGRWDPAVFTISASQPGSVTVIQAGLA